MYSTPGFAPTGQPPAQMIPHHLHARGPQVSTAAIPAISLQVGQIPPTNNEINDVQPMHHHKPQYTKRARQPAIISDPNSGRTITTEELMLNTPKVNSESISTNESHSGTSSLRNSPSMVIKAIV